MMVRTVLNQGALRLFLNVLMGYRQMDVRNLYGVHVVNTVRVASRNKPRTVALKAALTAIVAMIAMRASAQVEYVDPTIGNVGILLVPTRPTVYMRKQHDSCVSDSV